MKRKLFFGVAFLVLLLALFSPSISADNAQNATSETLPDEYTDFLESLPETLKELLPSSLFSDSREEVASGVKEMSDFSFLLATVGDLVGLRLSKCLSLFATLAGILLLGAVLRTISSSFASTSVRSAFSFCTTLVILVSLLRDGYESISSVASYLGTLTTLTRASLPLMGALYAMGGNMTAAVASSSSLTLFLGLLEEVVSGSILPLCGICLGFCVLSALDPSLRMQTLVGTIKKNYTTVLAFLMMLLLAMLAAQTTLASRTDTLAMKSVKFAAGNLIPVVGGSVSELLRTVSAGIGYLRGSVGLCGILLLLLLLLPTLIELFLLRLTWELGASLADLLGCDGEKKLLEEFASLHGYLIAAVSICSSVPILSFSLLLHCASAIG